MPGLSFPFFQIGSQLWKITVISTKMFQLCPRSFEDEAFFPHFFTSRTALFHLLSHLPARIEQIDRLRFGCPRPVPRHLRRPIRFGGTRAYFLNLLHGKIIDCQSKRWARFEKLAQLNLDLEPN